MRQGSKAFRKNCIVAGCLMLALQVGLAQNKTAGAGSANATRVVLVQKAHALESRGRPDMAIQIWQQILLSDPKNTEAMAGLARDFKLTGAAEKSSDALNRLRQINPNDPNIAKIESMTSIRVPERSPQSGRRSGPPGQSSTRPCAFTASSMAIVLQTAILHWPITRLSPVPRAARQAADCRHARPAGAQSRRSALCHRSGHHPHLRSQEPAPKASASSSSIPRTRSRRPPCARRWSGIRPTQLRPRNCASISRTIHRTPNSPAA